MIYTVYLTNLRTEETSEILETSDPLTAFQKVLNFEVKYPISKIQYKPGNWDQESNYWVTVKGCEELRILSTKGGE